MKQSEKLHTDTSLHESKRANPMGTDGFEFVEFTAKDPKSLMQLFKTMGFEAVAKHKTKEIMLYRQGAINFLLNQEPVGHAFEFAKEHGPSICSMAFRVRDAKFAHSRAITFGAIPVEDKISSFNKSVPAIYGIGKSLIYLVDDYENNALYQEEFIALPNTSLEVEGVGLDLIDHLTHNVYQGEMDKWAQFYEKIFNFYEIRYFDIEGKITGLTSRALSSPCGKIKIPLNQSKDDQSQIEEYLREYKGEGIQHIALYTKDIYHTVETMRQKGVRFLTVPDTYYELIDQRVPGHQEDLERLKKNRIIIDGAPLQNEGLLLQIFTENVIGPIFFEIIQRKGNEGFGEGNFQALFESIELDQIRRGVIKEE